MRKNNSLSSAQRLNFIFAFAVAVIYLWQLTNFTFFFSTYGDVKGHVLGTWPSWFNYQPVYPLLAGLIRRLFSVESIFIMHAVLYAGCLILIFKVGQICVRFGGYVMVLIALFNMRAYFYIARSVELIFIFEYMLPTAILVCASD
jgi:hypothetical protein